MTYTQSHIDEIIDSINCNNDIIKDLINQTNTYGKVINTKMSDYVKNSKKMNINQITAYKDYANDMSKFKDKMKQPPHNGENLHSIYKSQTKQEFEAALVSLHNKQVDEMEFLCSLVEKSHTLIGIF